MVLEGSLDDISTWRGRNNPTVTIDSYSYVLDTILKILKFSMWIDMV